MTLTTNSNCKSQKISYSPHLHSSRRELGLQCPKCQTSAHCCAASSGTSTGTAQQIPPGESWLDQAQEGTKPAQIWKQHSSSCTKLCFASKPSENWQVHCAEPAQEAAGFSKFTDKLWWGRGNCTGRNPSMSDCVSAPHTAQNPKGSGEMRTQSYFLKFLSPQHAFWMTVQTWLADEEPHSRSTWYSLNQGSRDEEDPPHPAPQALSISKEQGLHLFLHSNQSIGA